jgi:cell division protein FtsL
MHSPPLLDTRQWANRSVVLERDHHRVRWLWLVLLSMMVTTAPATVYLVQQNRCVELQYQANELRGEQERLREVERRLRAERAALQSPEAVARWAARQDDLVRPGHEQVFALGRD